MEIIWSMIMKVLQTDLHEAFGFQSSQAIVANGRFARSFILNSLAYLLLSLTCAGIKDSLFN